MKTLRHYLAREIMLATALVMAALLMLFAFFDLVEEIKDLGRGTYQLRHIVRHVVLSIPTHAYELFPIAALIGTLFALAQLVANSEYTVMRTAGVSVTRMVLALMSVGLMFALLTFVLGEYIGPEADQAAQRMRSRAITGIVAQEFRSGLWMKDDTSFINVLEVTPEGNLRGIRIYEFDRAAKLRLVSFAKRGTYQGERRWLLEEIVQTTFTDVRTETSKIPSASWQSVLEPSLLNVLLVKPEKMSAASLYSYAQHLRENRQKTLRYEIAMWSKATYPAAVLTMMILALPFAYTQRRQGGVGAKIFTGIMLGLAFYFLSRLSAHLGLLNEWPPAASALMPMSVFLCIALTMMWWQERR
ncbi:MAG: LPS export ABC transporter permease LptG [Burkholderiales bacterium]